MDIHGRSIEFLDSGPLSQSNWIFLCSPDLSFYSFDLARLFLAYLLNPIEWIRPLLRYSSRAFVMWRLKTLLPKPGEALVKIRFPGGKHNRSLSSLVAFHAWQVFPENFAMTMRLLWSNQHRNSAHDHYLERRPCGLATATAKCGRWSCFPKLFLARTCSCGP